MDGDVAAEQLDRHALWRHAGAATAYLLTGDWAHAEDLAARGASAAATGSSRS